MSFWTLTPNVSQWTLIENIWKDPQPPQLLDDKPIDIAITLSEGIKLQPTQSASATEYSVFLEKQFSKYSEWRLQLPPVLIADGISFQKWIGVEARTKEGHLIGIIFSIPFDKFYAPGFQDYPLTNLGLVDYFCIHPSWRKKGLGTRILHSLFAATKLVDRKAHVFASEGGLFNLFHKVPSFVKNTYIWRERIAIGAFKKNISISKFNGQLPFKIQDSSKVFIGLGAGSADIKILSYNTNAIAHIVVKPTYERKGNKSVGEVIAWYEEEKGLCDFILDSLELFDIYLAPSNFQQMKKWNRGATYAYYPFHFNPEQFSGRQFLRLF
jgi:GNAT superfamily N-acetyltransferase